MLIGIPVIMLIYKAVKVLFKIKTENKALNWSALALWIVGLGLSIIVVSSVAGDFRTKETERMDVQIAQPVADTLKLDLINDNREHYDWFPGDDENVNVPWSASADMDSISIDNVKLDIVKASGDQFELVQIASSRGANRKSAYQNAKHIVYEFRQDSNSLYLNEYFILPKGSKFRGQKLQLILKVPVGKAVFLSDEMEDIIYDIKNVTNTYDGNMVGKTWTMTDRGLECIGCNLPDRNAKNGDVRIRINDSGVNVEGVEMNSDSSFTIDGDDVKIQINDEGVHIDTRKK
jgi:hypothetical protein